MLYSKYSETQQSVKHPGNTDLDQSGISGHIVCLVAHCSSAHKSAPEPAPTPGFSPVLAQAPELSVCPDTTTEVIHELNFLP